MILLPHPCNLKKYINQKFSNGAHDRDWTDDLFLTMEALYRLSYVGTQKNIQKILKVLLQKWSGKRDSNPRPSAWKADALPIELFPHLLKFWWGGEDSNLRRLSRQIYSLIPLTTREPPLTKPNFPMELARGLEPPTCWLQISCSTNWATPAKRVNLGLMWKFVNPYS